MTVTNINTSPIATWQSPNKTDSETLPKSESIEKESQGSEKLKTNRNPKTEVSLESLVLKPSPVTLEERMDQVISFEEMKNLLSMMAKSSKKDSEKRNFHLIDVKR